MLCTLLHLLKCQHYTKPVYFDGLPLKQVFCINSIVHSSCESTFHVWQYSFWWWSQCFTIKLSQSLSRPINFTDLIECELTRISRQTGCPLLQQGIALHVKSCKGDSIHKSDWPRIHLQWYISNDNCWPASKLSVPQCIKCNKALYIHLRKAHSAFNTVEHAGN